MTFPETHFMRFITLAEIILSIISQFHDFTTGLQEEYRWVHVTLPHRERHAESTSHSADRHFRKDTF
jgi:hypothetical protein